MVLGIIMGLATGSVTCKLLSDYGAGEAVTITTSASVGLATKCIVDSAFDNDQDQEDLKEETPLNIVTETCSDVEKEENFESASEPEPKLEQKSVEEKREEFINEFIASVEKGNESVEDFIAKNICGDEVLCKPRRGPVNNPNKKQKRVKRMSNNRDKDAKALKLENYN